MKYLPKYIFVLVIFMFACKAPEGKKEVYVCISSSASTFHRSEDCSALKKCNDQVLFVSLEKAKEHKRKPCKTCKRAAKAASKQAE